jgi:probable O-glycosylation ligase (exosortase A-associated)
MKGLIFTYALTYGGAVVSLFNPFVGLLIYICFSIVRPEYMWYWSVPGGNYSRIVAIALLAGWVLHGFGSWKFGKAWGPVLALIGFLLWSGMSALAAPLSDRAYANIEELSKIVLPFLVGITTIDSVRKLKQLTWVILLSQGYVAFELNLVYYEGFNRVHEQGFGGMDNNCVAIAMVTGVGFAFFLGLSETKWWLKYLSLGSAAMMAHVVMMAFSRGGMLALIINGFVSFALIRKQPKHYIALALGALLALRLAGAEVQARFFTSFADQEERDTSAQSRLDLWADCWDAMLKRPILGAGPDHWGFIATEYGWPLGKEAHSLWMQLGAELGFPGVLLLLYFYGSTITRIWGFIRRPPPGVDPWFGDAYRMVVASLIGFVVSAQFVTVKGIELPYYVVLIGAGLLKLSTEIPAESPAREEESMDAEDEAYFEEEEELPVRYAEQP